MNSSNLADISNALEQLNVSQDVLTKLDNPTTLGDALGKIPTDLADIVVGEVYSNNVMAAISFNYDSSHIGKTPKAVSLWCSEYRTNKTLVAGFSFIQPISDCMCVCYENSSMSNIYQTKINVMKNNTGIVFQCLQASFWGVYRMVIIF